jgi:hypothetical protein
MEQQRRGRKIAMSEGELGEFLGQERTCRVGTVSRDGTPHVTPLWFVWDGRAIWLNSIVRSQRWVDIERQPTISVMVDAGVEFMELRGAEITGTASAVGEVPRTGAPLPELDEPERLFARKYSGSDQMHWDGRHAWLRVEPTKISSWDFRKMGAAPG